MKVANWYFGIGLLAALVALPTSVGAWSYEQIEPASNWSWVETEVMPTGMVCVCYHDSVSGHIFVAHKDSIWHRDDLGEWFDSVGHHLVIGPAGKPAVLLKSDTITIYTVLTDTGWNFAAVQCTTGYTFLAFDSSGNASLLYYYLISSFPLHCLASSYERGGVWTTDIIHRGYYDGLFWNDPICPTTFVLGSGNRFYDDRGYFRGFTMGDWNQFVDSGRTGAWGTIFVTGTQHRGLSGVSLAPGPSSEFAVCYNMYNYSRDHEVFYCDTEMVESLPVGPGRVRIDSRDLRQIVYRLGVMKLAYRTGVWHIDTLPPQINAAASFDFAVDNNDMPLIAFSTADGIFLATGDAVGVNERKPQVVREPLRLPTIVRGTLWLPRVPEGSDPLRNPPGGVRPLLLDISGRKVLDLSRGPNDVSRFAPGVYFVRSAADRRAQKVVIER